MGCLQNLLLLLLLERTNSAVWVNVEPLEVFTAPDPSGWTCAYAWASCSGCSCGNGCCSEVSGCPFSASCGGWGAAAGGMLGGYGRFGGNTAGFAGWSYAEKTFTGLPTHTKLRVSFTFFKFDSWDNEKVLRATPSVHCPADACVPCAGSLVG